MRVAQESFEFNIGQAPQNIKFPHGRLNFRLTPIYTTTVQLSPKVVVLCARGMSLTVCFIEK